MPGTPFLQPLQADQGFDVSQYTVGGQSVQLGFAHQHQVNQLTTVQLARAGCEAGRIIAGQAACYACSLQGQKNDSCDDILFRSPAIPVQDSNPIMNTREAGDTFALQVQ